jgi:hypothetical protein
MVVRALLLADCIYRSPLCYWCGATLEMKERRCLPFNVRLPERIANAL